MDRTLTRSRTTGSFRVEIIENESHRDEAGERSSESEKAVEERAAAAALDSASNRKAELNAAAAELHRALYYDGTGVPDAA